MPTRPPTTIHPIARLVAALLGLAMLLVASPALGQDRVTLRAVAAPAPRITLGDIALVDGPSAEALRAIEVWPGAQADASRGAIAPPRQIAPELVRQRLEAAGVNMGRVTIDGAPVRLEDASQNLPRGQAAPSSQRPLATPSGPTVRDALPAALAKHLGVGEGDVRITFDASDEALLATATTGRTVTIAPLGQSNRPGFHVRVYEGDRIVIAQSVRLRALVKREVLVATAPIERGQALGEANTTREERWLATAAPWLDASALGRVARGRIDPGELIEPRSVEEALAIRKGEVVMVDCISGSVVVRAQMRALADGRVDEVIEFGPLAPGTSGRERAARASREQGLVRARVAGPGRAVVQTGQ